MSMNPTEIFKNKFYDKFVELLVQKESNSFYMDKEQYKSYLDQVKSAKESKKLTTLQRRRLLRFDTFTIGGVEKLIVPLKEGKC